MTFINEFLPNPAGSDTQNEWVELFNGGQEILDLSGWKIVSGSGKFPLSGKSVSGKGYLLLPRSETKLILKNTDGMVFLYDANGRLVDSAQFLGSAPEGKSFSRLRQGYGGQGLQNFVWAEPTPGAANKISLNTNILSNTYPIGAPLNRNLGAVEFWSMLFGAAVVLAAIIMFVLKRNESLSKLFFGRDKSSWQ